MAAVQERAHFYAPIIDIAPFLHDPGSPAAQHVVDDVHRACISTGFFQITGHALDPSVCQGALDGAARFFALPAAEKEKLDCHRTVGFRGYDVLASETFEEDILPDLKEGYFLGDEIPPTHPMYGRFFSAPNVWPPARILPPESFQTPAERYFDAIRALSLKVLDLVGAALCKAMDRPGTDLPADLREMLYADEDLPPIMALRLLHYPAANPAQKELSKPQYGASAHTDYGLITLLLQDDNPGLEVLDTSPAIVAAGKTVWRPIDPTPGAITVNIADIVSRMTGGVYKSSVHRVVCKRPENERFSIAFFVDGCLDAKVRLLPEFREKDGRHAPAAEMECTIEEHLIDRLKMSYNEGKKFARLEGESIPVENSGY